MDGLERFVKVRETGAVNAYIGGNGLFRRGNPGRPRGSGAGSVKWHLVKLLQRRVKHQGKMGTYAQHVAEALLLRALGGSVDAIAAVLDRVDGPIRAQVGDTVVAVRVEYVTPAARDPGMSERPMLAEPPLPT